MKIAAKHVVVTGAAGGIGAALARRFAAEGARAVTIADVQEDPLEATATEIGATATAIPADLSREADVQHVIDTAEATNGPIDLFCSNAGVGVIGGPEVPDDLWRLSIDVNVMAHVWAARHLIPRMLDRGGGYLLQTASAAGLLTQLGSAPYSVTKHAAVAFAEWIAITYGDRGLKVSVLAPQAVRTAMTANVPGGGVAAVDGMMEPDEVAAATVAGLEREDFLILPHEQVHEYFKRKADDYDRWLAGMRRLQGRFPEPA
jgi:NAD(P)-dependent dehydrogenase (short-subunit alcohol dehydrogenase family)